MPSTCWGRYANVAVVEVLCDDQGARITPKMIGERARGIVRIAEHYGPQNVGKTEKCAFRQTLSKAQKLATDLNETTTDAK